MKTSKILYIFLFAIFLLSGCSDDFLKEKKNYDNYEENLFENEVITDWYVASLYHKMYSAYRSPTLTLVGEYKDDKTKMTEEIGGTVGDFIDENKLMEQASQASGYYGAKLSNSINNNPYTRIRNCNILIEKAETVGRGHLSDEYIDKIKGQAYFLRAIQYFDLVRTYGGVPIVTEVQEITSDNPAIQLPRSKSSECFDQIAKDLDEATRLLPDKWDSEYGKATKYAALAMKSRVLLTAASPLFNKDWDNTAGQPWKDALAASLTAERELSSGDYGLYGSSAKDWSEMFYNSDNAFCKEAIMVQLLSPAISGALNSGWENGIRLTSQDGGGGIAAPKEMIDLFPMSDGKRPIRITTTPPNGNYNDSTFFLNRDPRFYRTFAFNGCKWAYGGETNAVVWAYRYKYEKKDNNGNITIVSAFSGNNQIKSPAFVRKMSDPKLKEFSRSGTDIYEYRYAELLLNIAECYAATGDIGNCITYLGKIRARVGIANDNNNNYGIGNLADKYAALEACLYERRVELAYEGKRFWDIQRWMLYQDDAATGNNTCAKLGIAPINGTTRTGHYWEVKTVGANSKDPLETLRAPIVIDPDASDFKIQLDALAAFNKAHLKRVDLDNHMDGNAIGGGPKRISWRQNYYISGLNSQALNVNPWLKQTIGWNDAFGGAGTYEYNQ